MDVCDKLWCKLFGFRTTHPLPLGTSGLSPAGSRYKAKFPSSRATPARDLTCAIPLFCIHLLFALKFHVYFFISRSAKKYQTQITYSIQRMIFVSLERPFPSCPKRFTWRSTGPSDDNTYVKSYFRSWKKCPLKPKLFICLRIWAKILLKF